MTGVPRGTPFFFFDSFSAAAAPDASAKTSAAASAESLRVLPCRTIFLKRRGDVARERPKAHAAAAPLLLAVDAGNGQIVTTRGRVWRLRNADFGLRIDKR